MSSEFYVFDDDGKDNAARRALFNTFINLVAPQQNGSEEKGSLNIDLEQDRHFAGFRKSAGVWYHNDDKKDKCWDRRLVLWLRAQKGSYLPFYNTDGELVTVRGKPLEEAAVCTLEVVLRNTAAYTTGFLLLPKYKKRQEQCIGKASSWIVIGYFPYPSDKNGPIKRIDGCETDQEKIQTLLVANKPNRNESSKRVAARDGDFKPSSSSVVTPSKRMYKMPCGNQNKRRNIDPELHEYNKEPKSDMESSDSLSPSCLSATSSSSSSCQTFEVKKETNEEVKEEKLTATASPETTTIFTDMNGSGMSSMCSEDAKEEDDYEYDLSYNSQIDFDPSDFYMSLFPPSGSAFGFGPFGAGASDFMPDFNGSQLSPLVEDAQAETAPCDFTPAASSAASASCHPEDESFPLMPMMPMTEENNGSNTGMMDLFRTSSSYSFQPVFETTQNPSCVAPDHFNAFGESVMPFDFQTAKVK